MKEVNCFIFLGLICALTFSSPAHAQDSAKTSPGKPDQVIADLISDNETKSRNAALQIRNSADQNWLPRLAPLLESPQGRSRQIVTMLVLGIYPDKAFDFFSKAATSESVFAREAAMYGLARVPATTVIAPLFQGTNDTHETVRNAAL
ncbi:MAG: HEAT repeat domain-containing protein, partial [Planctomycetota bacterium]